MALLAKDGEVVEVVDPAAPALLADGWEEATAEEARVHYTTPGDPAEAVNTSHEAKRARAVELGLDPDVVQNHAALSPVEAEPEKSKSQQRREAATKAVKVKVEKTEPEKPAQ